MASMPLRRMTFNSTSAGPLGRFALQLRDIADRQIEITGEHGLALTRALTQRTDFVAADRFRNDIALTPKWRNVIFSCAAASRIPTRHVSSAVSSNALVMRLGFLSLIISHVLQSAFVESFNNPFRVRREPRGDNLM
jgi:hypothetical protein